MLKSGIILKDQYHLFRPLASGITGETWLALDVNLGREVAIKFIKLSLIPAYFSLRETIYKDSIIFRQIMHPNIPKILDFFELQDSQFIVMDFIQGMNLREMFENKDDFSSNNSSSLKKILESAIELTKIIKFLHENKPSFIHKDIKPENIKIISSGKLFLLDFGIAKDFTKVYSEKSTHVHSLSFKSLEQISNSDLTERSDFYSIGATLYYLLLGCRSAPPNALDRVKNLTDSGLDLLKPINSLNPSVPSELSEIISKAMSLKPTDRPDSASNLLRSLEYQLLNLRKSRIQTSALQIRSNDISYSYDSLAKIQASSQSTPTRNLDSTEELLPIAKSKFGIEFSRIPSGSFIMGNPKGSPDEQFKHEVIISNPFLLGVFPITQLQWETIVKAENPSHFRNCPHNPVENVSWLDIGKFLDKLNSLNDVFLYRLPTEAEWEYSCRATTQDDYYGPIDKISWHSKNSNFSTQIVGRKRPNLFGLYDMLGNVWEWCQDWYDETFYRISEKVDPKGPKNGSYKVLRGGAWNYAPQSCRVSTRLKLSPDVRRRYVGFRVLAILNPSMGGNNSSLRL